MSGKIDHHDFHALEILRRRFESFGGASVQRPHLATGDRIADVGHCFHVLRDTIKPVLRREKAHQRTRFGSL